MHSGRSPRPWTHLVRVGWVKIVGGGYLIYLTARHFLQGGSAEDRSRPKPALPWLGPSALWGTVVKVELVNVAFSVDSILVAVAMSRKSWVVLSGGLLGIVAIRVEYLNAAGYVHFEIDKWLSLLLIVVIFTAAYLYARRRGPVTDDDPMGDEAAFLLRGKS